MLDGRLKYPRLWGVPHGLEFLHDGLSPKSSLEAARSSSNHVEITAASGNKGLGIFATRQMQPGDVVDKVRMYTYNTYLKYIYIIQRLILQLAIY